MFAFDRTEDADVIFTDAEACGLMIEDFAWIVSERAFDADNVPVGMSLSGKHYICLSGKTDKLFVRNIRSWLDNMIGTKG